MHQYIYEISFLIADATPRSGNDYGNTRSSGPIVWSDVYCYDDEKNLLECSYSTSVYDELCDHTRDVGVHCQGIIYVAYLSAAYNSQNLLVLHTIRMY